MFISNKNYNCNRNIFLNFLKGLGCIGVVFIHICFPGKFGIAISQMSQFAVPIFLMISGYFTYSEDSSSARIYKRIRRLCIITLVSIILYTLYTLYFTASWGITREWFSPLLSIEQWVQIILFSNLDIIMGNHLWFLPAQIIAYFCILLIDRCNSYKVAYISLPFLLVIRNVISFMFLSYNISWHYRDNFLVEAFTWMLLGHYIASKRHFFNKLSAKLLISVIAISLLFSLSFSLFAPKVNFAEIGNTFYSIALFVLAINNPSKSINHMIEFVGDKLSLYIYVLHIAIGGIVGIIVATLGYLESKYYLWLRPIIVVITSILVAATFYMFTVLYQYVKSKIQKQSIPN